MTDTPGPMSGLAGVIRRPRPSVPLDGVDRAMLRKLAENSRISQRRLAREMEMSAPTSGARLARLERLGVIRGYTIAVDWSAIGYPIAAYIPMIVSAGADIRVVVSRLREIPELDELIVVTGTYDLLTRFRLRDHMHLRGLMLDQLRQVPGLQRIETFLSLGEAHEDDVVARLLGRSQ